MWNQYFRRLINRFQYYFLKLYLTAYMQLLKVAVYLYKEKRVLPLTKK
ncbi:hypothetical protein NEISICOT_00628 [Neisseria sicca ATCC 29256]|uniref:Uncharacterized protein n=1 Tax=Neisseria sicca ATCC 29256 TaxID=547045 RepID=C6M289_NEISI|nr:hypothetical protein NEISICOT_00628 [Neisseria sicca ATCC 29256]